MDTSLKRSKKIRAFCYRLITVAALVTAIGSAIMGREALLNAYECRFSPYVLYGDVYYLRDFREYVGRMHNNAMIGYAGIGDDKGYPLTDTYANEYSKKAMAEFHDMIEETQGDILFYVKKADGTEDSNITYPIFSEYDGHLLLPDDVKLCWYWNGTAETWNFYDYHGLGGYIPQSHYYEAQYSPNKEVAAQMQMIIAVKDDCRSALLNKMEWKAAKFSYVLAVCSISAVVWLIFGMLSLFTGKAAKQAKRDFAAVSGKLWLEIKVVLTVLLIYMGCCYKLHWTAASLNVRMSIYDSMWLYAPIACFFYLLYTDIRQNGGRTFANSLPVKCYVYIREGMQAVPWYRKTMIICGVLLAGSLFLIGYGIYTMTLSPSRVLARQALRANGIVMVVIGVICLAGFLYLRYFLKDADAVVHKLSEMRQGRGQVPLKLSKKSLLIAAANDLNELEAGIEKAVEEQSRSNKMKVELIANVSHDLKTPLTSIINYADLLCEEELPDAATDYAKALRQKAYRLKYMVQDVFDLSKATSGNLTVEMAVIDLVKLIKQTLADMDEKIQESDLLFKLNISKEPLLIEADGEKMYRVFQNLFVNALQYSLEHSRVHIQLLEENGFAVAKVKNTSRQELDFDTGEIVERFVRADSSRTTEGSGLGLSIVQSFTEACGGQFTIETDADMFTACVRFPMTKQARMTEVTEIVLKEE